MARSRRRRWTPKSRRVDDPLTGKRLKAKPTHFAVIARLDRAIQYSLAGGYWIASKSDVSDFDNLMPKSGNDKST
jgi:hypothetical protein